MGVPVNVGQGRGRHLPGEVDGVKVRAVTASIQRFDSGTEIKAILGALEEDGAVIVEGLLSQSTVDAVNAEVEPAIAAADPQAEMFNPIFQAFHGAQTRQVSGMPGISPTFATDVMCNPVLLALADAILLPNCARYQLNIGHLLQRGPGAEDQWLHRDEAVWSDVPKPSPELQLASVIAFVDFTRENGATRVVPGSHRWPDRQLSPFEQVTSGRQPTEDDIAYAEMPAGSAVIYTGGTIHGGGGNTTDVQRRGAHLSYCLGWLRTEENNYLSVPADVAARLPRQAQEVLGYAVHDSAPRGGGYLGMVRMQDPVELLARGEL
ncbi:MAG: phytanoyl-CoA dioxygenase family protein [Actinobacteria bacterium]|nr:phytanoyl-CoA dioxygenase family protein [Actinomycetota bacterium]